MQLVSSHSFSLKRSLALPQFACVFLPRNSSLNQGQVAILRPRIRTGHRQARGDSGERSKVLLHVDDFRVLCSSSSLPVLFSHCCGRYPSLSLSLFLYLSRSLSTCMSSFTPHLYIYLDMSDRYLIYCSYIYSRMLSHSKPPDLVFYITPSGMGFIPCTN